jgi:hypothetical protein
MLHGVAVQFTQTFLFRELVEKVRWTPEKSVDVELFDVGPLFASRVRDFWCEQVTSSVIVFALRASFVDWIVDHFRRT